MKQESGEAVEERSRRRRGGGGGGREVRYLGVRRRRWGRWVSEIRLPRSRDRIWLGSYDSPEKAARAFDAAAFSLLGPAARLNFPHQLPPPAGGAALSHRQIQAAAARHASHPPADDQASDSATTAADNHELDESLIKFAMDTNADFPAFTDDFLHGFFPAVAAPLQDDIVGMDEHEAVDEFPVLWSF